MITKRSAIVFNVFAKLIVCLMFLWLAGCKSPFWAQHGETYPEGDRRHVRNLRVNQQGLSGDIDRAMLFDKPSQATPLRIPAPVEPRSPSK